MGWSDVKEQPDRFYETNLRYDKSYDALLLVWWELIKVVRNYCEIESRPSGWLVNSENDFYRGIREQDIWISFEAVVSLINWFNSSVKCHVKSKARAYKWRTGKTLTHAKNKTSV